ncbi:hypothetical protein ACIGXM_17725 [Kitasatospora sp. NPDC052896]|uniref:hypothetical protein n=1 Tax=Kitasatospora sp. NPDC052896 TaxID=3364061 RepID=UPI0037CB76B6
MPRTSWTAVLLSTALAGGLAGSAAASAPGSPGGPVGAHGHPVIRPVAARASAAARTTAALGALGEVLRAAGDLAGAVAPGGDRPDPGALRGRLDQLDTASGALRRALPADPAAPSPVEPRPVLPGGPLRREAPAPAGSVEDRLGVLAQDAANLVAAATERRDATAVDAALPPFSADLLGLSSATVTRLSRS